MPRGPLTAPSARAMGRWKCQRERTSTCAGPRDTLASVLSPAWRLRFDSAHAWAGGMHGRACPSRSFAAWPANNKR